MTRSQARITSDLNDLPLAEINEACNLRNKKLADWVHRDAPWRDPKHLERELLRIKEQFVNGECTPNERDEKEADVKRRWGYIMSRVYMFNSETAEFPAGLVDVVSHEVQIRGHDVEVHDEEQDLDHIQVEWTSELPLWKHQAEAAAVMKEERLGLISIPTGGGKTLLFAHAIATHKVRTLVVVQKLELMLQLKDEIERYTDLSVGCLGGGSEDIKDVTIAIINSAAQKIDTLKQHGFDMVLVDEAHHAAAKLHWKVLRGLDPYYCYGFTGTPWRNESSETKALRSSFAKIIYHTDMDGLVHEGILSDMKLITLDHTTKYHPRMQWNEVRRMLYNDRKRNKAFVDFIASEYAARGAKSIVITKEIAHAESLRLMLLDCGVPTGVIHGKMPRSERLSNMAKIRSGEFAAVVGTVFDEGVDIKDADIVANPAGQKAKRSMFQRSGRGRRSAENKEFAIFLDARDLGHHITVIHSKERIKACEDLGMEIDPDVLKWATKSNDLAQKMSESRLQEDIETARQVMERRSAKKKRRRQQT